MTMHRGRMTLSMRRALFILPFWLFSVYWMWNWWIFDTEINFLAIYVVLTFAMIYEFTLLPSFFMFFLLRSKIPKRRIAPKNQKVAVITLCVPSSESLDIIERQLIAMTNITYPHDSWILDEGKNTEIKKMAKKYGVMYFSRKGVKKYNQPDPPFKAKTKAGNVNAWLQHVKRRKYDYFVQFDIDHIAKPNYLNKTLGHFRDEKVGWVQAPSVYSNLTSWTARGAAEQELVLQGPLQMGFYGFSKTPFFIIGSHCTYRMSAIRKIGGFQPTRAEDHLDTLYLSKIGYKGVFIPEIIAEGDGPETLSTYLAQQFAWAYSMFQVLIDHTPRAILTLSWKQRFQFLFAQTWYPFWSLSYLVLFLSPLIALWLNRDIVTASPNDMLIHFMPVFLGGFLVWWAGRPLMQPQNISLTWRGIILHAIRWPIILRAILAAFFRVKKPYMITPKGKFSHTAPSIETYRPFLGWGLLCLFSVIINDILRLDKMTEAQSFFALSNSIFMLSVCLVDLIIRYKAIKPKFRDLRLEWIKPVSAVWFFIVLFIAANFINLYTLNDYAEAESKTNKNLSAVNVENDQDYSHKIANLAYNKNQTPRLGIYEQNPSIFTASKTPIIQHDFIDWRNESKLAKRVYEIEKNQNTPLITIEPKGESYGTKLLNDINQGIYDKRLNKIADVLKNSKSPIYIRFAHEMELEDLYPWGNQDPSSYIEAYKRAAKIFKSSNPNNIKMVWSPAGNPGAEAYYPGDEYVDVIGVTVLHDSYWYGDNMVSFYNLVVSRQWTLNYHKPLWIVEFGAGHSTPAIQKEVISEARNQYRDYGYDVLIYLNTYDVNINGPDYRINQNSDFLVDDSVLN